MDFLDNFNSRMRRGMLGEQARLRHLENGFDDPHALAEYKIQDFFGSRTNDDPVIQSHLTAEVELFDFLMICYFHGMESVASKGTDVDLLLALFFGAREQIPGLGLDTRYQVKVGTFNESLSSWDEANRRESSSPNDRYLATKRVIQDFNEAFSSLLPFVRLIWESIINGPITIAADTAFIEKCFGGGFHSKLAKVDAIVPESVEQKKAFFFYAQRELRNAIAHGDIFPSETYDKVYYRANGQLLEMSQYEFQMIAWRYGSFFTVLSVATAFVYSIVYMEESLVHLLPEQTRQAVTAVSSL